MQTLKIGSFNINGLGKRFTKLQNNELKKLVETYDILFLLETWIDENTLIDVSSMGSFYSINKARKRQNLKARRNSGGIICIISKKLKNIVCEVQNKFSDFLWIKIDKNFTRTDYDIYVCGCYISQNEEHAPVLSDQFGSLA